MDGNHVVPLVPEPVTEQSVEAALAVTNPLTAVPATIILDAALEVDDRVSVGLAEFPVRQHGVTQQPDEIDNDALEQFFHYRDSAQTSPPTHVALLVRCHILQTGQR